MQKWYVVGATLLIAGAAHAQDAASESLSQQMSARSHACDYKPVKLAREGLDLWRANAASHDCDSLQMAVYLLLESSNVLGEGKLPEELIDLEIRHACSIDAYALAYSLGYSAILRNELETAAIWFEKCLNLAASEPEPYMESALQALAVVHMRLGNRPDAMACLEQAYALNPAPNNVEGINTLAYINYYEGDCQTALQWTAIGHARIAELRLDERVPPIMYEASEQALILTELGVYIALGDTLEARSTLEQLDLQGNFTQRELAAAATLLAYLQWLGDPDFALTFRPQIEAWTAAADEGNLRSYLGINARLVQQRTELGDTAWVQELFTLGQAPLPLRGLLSGHCACEVSADAVAGKEQFAGSKRHWMGLTALFAALTGAGMVALWRLRKWQVAGQKWSQRSPQDCLRFLTDCAESAPPRTARWTRNFDAVIALNTLLKRNQPPRLMLAELDMTAWSEDEKRVFEALRAGQRTNEIAQSLHLSMNRIYKIRRALRSKLNLASHISLDDWLTQSDES